MRCSIFEGELPDRYQREWSMGVHWGLEHLQKILSENVYGGLKQAQTSPFYEIVRPDFIPIYNIATGENILNAPMLENIRYSKRRLQAYLSKGINIEVIAVSILRNTV